MSGPLSKGAPAAKQGTRRLGAAGRAGVLVAVGLAAGCGRLGPTPPACPGPARTSRVTGFCLPRWVSLKSSEVYGRKGPGADYPAVFVYHVRGLPVQVVAETTQWRRICDPDGGAAWVNRSLLAGRRTVMAPAGAPTPLRQTPTSAGPVAALLQPHALAAVESCRAGWCKVSVQGRSGWVDAARVWGAAQVAVCR